MKALGTRVLKIIIGVCISLFFVWLTLRGDIECGSETIMLAGQEGCRSISKLAVLWSSLKTANYVYLIPYLVILVSIHFIKVFRWGILLEPLGRFSFSQINSASAVGFMALIFMPFRLGEFARPLFIAETGKIRSSAAMATIAVERVIDGMAMAIVLIAALLLSTPKTTDMERIQWVRISGWLVFGFFFALFLFFVFAYAKRDLAVGFLRKLVSPVSEKLAQTLAGMVDTFIGGLKMVPDPRKIFLFVVLTVMYWGINGVGMMVLSEGFGLPLEFAAAFAVLGVLVAGVMIPAGPAMMGTFHGAIIIGMRLFFPDPSQYGAVVAYAWVLWGAQLVQSSVFGLYYLATGRVTINKVWKMLTGIVSQTAMGSR